MSAGAIGGTAAAMQVPVNSFADLGSQDFLRVMLEELSNQDPFEPTDSAALLEQLSSLRSIETQIELQEKLESLVMQNQITSAGGLIGRTVTGLDSSNNTVAGVVRSVHFSRGVAALELDTGSSLSIERVIRILGNDGTPADTTSHETSTGIRNTTSVG